MKMSDVDVLIESTIAEAPVGMISRGVKKLLGKLPGDIGDKATGQLQVGEFANQLKKDYSYFLGKTGYERSRESLQVFLNQTGLSDAALDTAISSATSGSPSTSNQDWKIYPGRGASTQTNRAQDPVVDIGSATDSQGVQPLDDVDPKIAAARQKGIDARARAQQQAKSGDTTATTSPQAKQPDTQQPAASGASTSTTPLNYPADDYVKNDWYHPTANPTGSELPPPPPEDTGTNSDDTPGYKPEPEEIPQYSADYYAKLDLYHPTINPTGNAISTTIDRLEPVAAAIDSPDVYTAYYNVTKMHDDIANRPDTATMKAALDDFYKVLAKHNWTPTGGVNPTNVNKQQAPATTTTSGKKGQQNTNPTSAVTLKAQQDKIDALANVSPEVEAAFKHAKSMITQYTRSRNLKNPPVKLGDAEDAIAKLDAVIAANQNTKPSVKAPGLKPVDPNSLSGKLSTAIASKKNPTAQKGQIGLPGYEPGGVADQEEPEEPTTSPEADSTQLDIHDVKAKAKPKKKVSLGDETKTVKAKAKSPKAAEVEKEEPPKAKPTDTETTTDKVKQLGSALVAAVNAYNKDKSDEDLKHAVQVAKLKYEKAKKEAEDEDTTPSTASGFGSELGKIASRMKSSKSVKPEDEEPTTTADDEDAWMDQAEPMPKAKKAKAAKNKKMALAASIEHEYDYLLAEDELTNKQVDKILLAIAQDNVRKNIVDLGRRPTTNKKAAQQPSGKPSSSYSAPSYTSGSTGSSQYTQQRQQSTGGKTLDLSDLNVERLISAINHILKKEELQRYEENQLKKLMQELKAVREGRALQASMLAEAPMGLGQRLATGVASKFSAQAAGKLDAGKIANQYKPEYSRYLGSTGGNPDAQSLIDFFTSKRLDTSKIQQIADSVAPNATRLTGQQIDTIIMQVTQENIRNGKITPAAAAQASGGTAQPASQSTAPVMAQRMMNDPAVQSHPEYIRFLNSLK